MEIQVDPLLCEANGRCADIAPDIFLLDEDDVLEIRPPEGEGRADLVRRAVASCPRAALSMPVSDTLPPLDGNKNEF